VRLCLFAFGKLKTPGLRDAAEYYKRLIRPWVNLEEIELKALPVPEKMSSTRTRIQEKEGEILLERLKKSEPSGRSWVILLDELGKAKATKEWATELEKFEAESVPSISYCIGSSLGFSQEVRCYAKSSISFGPQTLSHELARVVLLEQLYRAYSVIKGHPYHNAGS
jgi:23S rRNA (pseudouridine1915-N3)-methyltransferase